MHAYCAFVLGAGASQMNHRQICPCTNQPNIYCIAGGMLVGSVSMNWEEKTENGMDWIWRRRVEIERERC